jgi:hypothetical protein
MTPRSIQYYPDPLSRPFFPDRFEEQIEADRVHMGQQPAATASRRWRDRHINPDPFIPIIDDPWRAMPEDAPPSPKPPLQPEPPLVEGDDALDPGLPQRGGEIC